ncbi:hypothetical protein [Streptomyces sp. NPDC007940]|uniref:hypothetical protein n=1 Tax=Streptomyces sp. NPDC007940 TaxID=3364796 RepID=UPI000F4FCC83
MTSSEQCLGGTEQVRTTLHGAATRQSSLLWRPKWNALVHSVLTGADGGSEHWAATAPVVATALEEPLGPWKQLERNGELCPRLAQPTA